MSNVCLWNHCLLPASELSLHLSKEHIGWKKAEYKCQWDDCHRKNIVWHSRFSFANHLHLHTGESPFECGHCHKTFSNMEGLDRHAKLDHEQLEKKVPASIKKKRKLQELQQRYNDQLSDDSDDLEELPLLLEREVIQPRVTHIKNKVKKDSMMDQYKLAKAQLNYILRENEMLCDEWATTEKKLKRLRTERRVLLDALVKRGYNNEDED
ncbi:uncharacterized protein EV154DRAFT_567645 [Mucor mucedo]|uniref:uncharacterized protein n=1 Tax=Mucor mucedo TaxID=29922 RepID=UPI0022211DE0|nr:uncharacterized protein EV154DRAFT_567645 [Mucor mucedo]KAI7886396.1 hypothetical protein EV154DRAFT_567645 [Mucor mucedo]